MAIDQQAEVLGDGVQPFGHSPVGGEGAFAVPVRPIRRPATALAADIADHPAGARPSPSAELSVGLVGRPRRQVAVAGFAQHRLADGGGRTAGIGAPGETATGGHPLDPRPAPPAPAAIAAGSWPGPASRGARRASRRYHEWPPRPGRSSPRHGSGPRRGRRKPRTAVIAGRRDQVAGHPVDRPRIKASTVSGSSARIRSSSAVAAASASWRASGRRHPIAQRRRHFRHGFGERAEDLAGGGAPLAAKAPKVLP